MVDEIIAILRDAGGATLRERTGIWAAKVLIRHLQESTLPQVVSALPARLDRWLRR